MQWVTKSHNRRCYNQVLERAQKTWHQPINHKELRIEKCIKENSDKEKLTKHWHGEYQLQETQGNHCKNGQKKASDNNPTSSLFEIVVVNAMPKRHTDEYDQIEEEFEYCFFL